MGNGARTSQGLNGAVDHSAVREELQRVLDSPEFRASRRCREFLHYVVEAALDGRSDTLKERTIGIEVLGRPAAYDPSDDATVRVKAGEVRKRLGLYYAREGALATVRIELPAGTYVPEFSPHQPASVTAGEATSRALRRRNWLWLAGIAVAGAALAGWLLWANFRPSERALDQFWAPVLRGTAPVLICASYVPAYARDIEPTSSSNSATPGFVLLPDQFVGGGDLVAVSRMAALLSRLHRDYRVKLDNDVSLGELRSAPAILVGYSHTRYKDISKELRYFIDIDRRPLMVVDNGVPTPWALPDLKTDRHTAEDYAVVSRVFHPDTREMLVEIAGITQYGTDAAAELVTHPELMAEALRTAPPGWQKKNLQLVIHVKVMGGTPAGPKVVAAYFW